MVIKKIPAGIRIYLTKKKGCCNGTNSWTSVGSGNASGKMKAKCNERQALYIQPDNTLINDNLYVAYDVRVNGETIIPKGTRVIGNWVTESNPSIAAQLQLTKIYLYNEGQEIHADSDVIETISDFNSYEVNNARHITKLNHYQATSNISRRIVNYQCHVKTLLDHNLNSAYVEILTKEIPVILTADFVTLVL